MAKAALAILAFAVVMWVTEAVTYPVSATLILGLMILLLGLSPVQDFLWVEESIRGICGVFMFVLWFSSV